MQSKQDCINFEQKHIVFGGDGMKSDESNNNHSQLAAPHRSVCSTCGTVVQQILIVHESKRWPKSSSAKIVWTTCKLDPKVMMVGYESVKLHEKKIINWCKDLKNKEDQGLILEINNPCFRQSSIVEHGKIENLANITNLFMMFEMIRARFLFELF